MRFDVVTLFPEMVNEVAKAGVLGRAVNKQLIELACWNPRDYTRDRHRTVDDRPYGGGPGMLMKVQPLRDAIHDAKQANNQAKVIYLSPQGKKLDQQAVQQMATQPGLILVAGRYEGIDERLIETEIDEEWSIGDYVLSGGELAALVLIDAVARMIPGVLGDDDSAAQDSFMDGLLDCPHYTRPEEFEGRTVPPVLLSGNHQDIATWRMQQALGRTWLRRPELLAKLTLTEHQQRLLQAFQVEYRQGQNKD
ncbi:MAG: tRNA (guanosine(37)-N1)-methyltransferase TrmD [Gammaproteobacteria bacterium]|jgi:tRNA (guanine37-N1)-methyltransferase|nr:tRNA (guanosine(37)-N1)-methyltransferase TrmD [Gammaproteobacteria bacterium]